MTTYFTSDLHIGHRLVAGLRGFLVSQGIPDVEMHTVAIRDAFNVVRPDDIVWILGDICISDKTWHIALEALKRLPGRKRLVNGNHDPVSSIHRDAWKHQREALEVFESVQDFARIRIGGRITGTTVLLSHYPYRGTGSEGTRGVDGGDGEERYSEFRLTDYGTPLIHGHTHGPEKLHFSDAGTPQIHVGMDAWNMQLVTQDQVEDLLDTKLASAIVEP